MKFRRRLTAIIMGIVLAVLVISSLVLSVFIWTNDERFAQLSPHSDSYPIYHRNIKGLHNLFMPTHVFAYRHGIFYQVNDTKNNLPLEFSKEYGEEKRADPVLVSTSKRQFHRLLTNQAYVQLTFPDQISLDVLNDGFRHHRHAQFNRLFVKRGEMYAGDDRTYALYHLPIKEQFAKFLRLTRTAEQITPVRLRRLNSYYLVMYERNHVLHIYSYLVNQQPDSYFSSRLLGTTSVSRSSHHGTIAYTVNGGVYQRLTANEATHNYHYFNYYQGRKLRGTDRQLTESVYFVNQVGLMNQDLRFFEKNGTHVCYQNFIEGVPVFVSSRYQAQIAVDYQHRGLHVYFNSTDLQIPIPAAGQTEHLPSTQTILNRLLAAGIKVSDLQGLTIGYGIRRDQSHEKLVNLVPAYYAKIDNHWQSVNQILSPEPENQIEAQ